MPHVHLDVFRRLPTPAEQATLEAMAAKAYGSESPAEVVAAPGTQIIIELLPRLRPAPSRVVVLGPTYAEHAHAWRKAGHTVEVVSSIDSGDGGEVVVVVNPNNPDGRVLPRDALADLARALTARGGLLVVDESFADLEEDESLIRDRPRSTIVLRSFGKTYGFAGLRLGFAVTDRPLGDSLRSALGPWAVSGPAIAVGIRALGDREWRSAATVERALDARRLDDLLARAGTKVLGGTRLFRLAETEGSASLFDHLGRRGIWVRRFQQAPRQLRFGLPGSLSEWTRVQAALQDYQARREMPLNGWRNQNLLCHPYD
jgi:cobalamin biosynthetic protein CobC